MQPIVFHLVQYLMVVQATRYVDIYIYMTQKLNKRHHTKYIKILKIY